MPYDHPTGGLLDLLSLPVGVILAYLVTLYAFGSACRALRRWLDRR